ncbi:hypothetical protein Bca101_005415 [Brassica carinata]
MARLANLFDPFASLNCKQLSRRPCTLDLHFKSTTGVDSDSVPAAAKTKGAEEVGETEVDVVMFPMKPESVLNCVVSGTHTISDGEALIDVELSAGELIGGTGSVSMVHGNIPLQLTNLTSLSVFNIS